MDAIAGIMQVGPNFGSDCDQIGPEQFPIEDEQVDSPAVLRVEEGNDEIDNAKARLDSVMVKREDQGARGSNEFAGGLKEEKDDVASNMIAEVDWSNVREAYSVLAASESVDVLRNVDVLRRCRELSKGESVDPVLDFLFNHRCCPPEYGEFKENNSKFGSSLLSKSPLFGRRRAVKLLKEAIPRLKITEASCMRQAKKLNSKNHLLKFWQAHFVYRPWILQKHGCKTNQQYKKKQMYAYLRDTPDQLMKKKEEVKEKRLEDLRAELEEKERKLTHLKQTKELLSSRKVISAYKPAVFRKERMSEVLNKADNEMKILKDEIKHYHAVIPDMKEKRDKIVERNQKRNRRWRKKVEALEAQDTSAQKIAAVKSQNAFAKTLLQHEQNHLKEITQGRRRLLHEHDQMNFALDELNDGAVFDAVNYLDSSTKVSKPYRKDVVQMTVELVDCGVDNNSVETVYESVFKSVNLRIRNFPPVSRIKGFQNDDKK